MMPLERNRTPAQFVVLTPIALPSMIKTENPQEVSPRAFAGVACDFENGLFRRRFSGRRWRREPAIFHRGFRERALCTSFGDRVLKSEVRIGILRCEYFVEHLLVERLIGL